MSVAHEYNRSRSCRTLPGMWIPKLRSSSGPAYIAIVDAIAADVEARRLRPGDRLPPQRELAEKLGVAVATVTRAYQEAARRGLIAGEIGRGSFVLDHDPGNTTLEPASPGMIDLGPSWPIYSEDPDLRQTLRSMAGRPGLQRLLRYQPHAGAPAHRAAGAEWISRFGIEIPSPERVAVTAGVQHAMVTAFASSAVPGETILTEALTYPGMKAAARLLRLTLHGVAIDEEGLIPSALERAIRSTGASVLYTVPTVHNPTTGTQSEQRRQEIAAIARRRGLTIIEDDIHRPLIGKSPPAFLNLLPERTYYIGGLSKSVSGALRVAYLVYPETARDIAESLWATNWMASPITAEIAAMWIDDGTADRVVREKIAEAKRRQILAEKKLGAWKYQNNRAAPHFWLHLPEGLTSLGFAQAAVGAGVVVTPAEAFAAEGVTSPAAVRLSLSAPETVQEVETALVRLVRILEGRADSMGDV
jgi:DNA-binding transcriptional MocR family regulator